MGWYERWLVPRIINKALDTKPARETRARVVSGLSGDVLEIGFGSGLNLPHLPDTVTSLRGVDPSGEAAKLAARRIAAATVDVELIGLDGQNLPLPDNSVDAVLSTWTLCTIPDAVAAVREVRRVLRPGGTLHFVEHGRADDAGVLKWQNRLNGFQQRIAGGCNLNRDISAIITDGGMTISKLERYWAPAEPKPFGSMYEGIAVAD